MLSSVPSYTGIRECPVLQQHPLDLLRAGVPAQRDDALRRHHHVRHGQVRQLEGARGDLPRAWDPREPASPPPPPAAAAPRATAADSVKVVRSPKRRSTRLELAVRNQTSGRISQARPSQRPGDEQRVALGGAQRQGLGHQLAQHQRQIGHDRHHQREGHLLARPSQARATQRPDQPPGDRRAAEGRRGGAHHGDADLHRGQEALRVVAQRHAPRARARCLRSISSCRRVLRTERIAISAPAKTPLASISASKISNSDHMKEVSTSARRKCTKPSAAPFTSGHDKARAGFNKVGACAFGDSTWEVFVVRTLAVVLCLCSPFVAFAQSPEEVTAAPAKAHDPDRVHAPITVSPFHLAMPALWVNSTPYVELTGVFRAADEVGLAGIAGAGGVFGMFAFNIGAQARWYAIGDFEHGMSLGLEGMYTQLTGPTSSGTFGMGNGVSLSPMIGYKLATDVGFTLDLQAGPTVMFVPGRRDRLRAVDDARAKPQRECGLVLLGGRFFQ